MDKDTLYWVWLAQKLGAGNRHVRALLDRFGSAFEIYRADSEALTGFDREGNERFGVLSDKNLNEANAICRKCESLGVDIISLADERYPARLKSIQDPPAVLYCRGLLPQFDRLLCIAVVGTRKMSEYGCRSAYKISYGLSAAGVITVSGMALGVDSVVACAAFASGGHTVAVLGSGIDVVYPPRHRKIYEELLHRGTVLSEYPPGTTPTRYSFPLRNRIISGLCQGTFVVEGDISSGAMITARDALVQGRELFALPGNVGEANSNGTNTMIREGAHPVIATGDILREFLPLYSKVVDINRTTEFDGIQGYDEAVMARYGVDPGFGDKKETVINTTAVKQTADKRTENKPAKVFAGRKKNDVNELCTKSDGSREAYESLEPGLKLVYDKLPQDGAVPVDRLAVEGLNVGEIIATLTLLELRGLVQSLPGGLFTRT